MESKALISSPTSIKTRPKPLKTSSPNRNKTTSSPSPSPMRIQVTKSPDESPDKVKSATKNVKVDSESKFSSVIVSPK